MDMTLVAGVRITKETGISFFGVDEINAALKEGKQVAAVEPGDVLLHKTGENQGNVHLALCGFTIKFIVEG